AGARRGVHLGRSGRAADGVGGHPGARGRGGRLAGGTGRPRLPRAGGVTPPRSRGALLPGRSAAPSVITRPGGGFGRAGCRQDQPPADSRWPDVLLLLRPLPPGVRERSRGLCEERVPMLIRNEFEVAAPVERVWAFFGDIPQVAACLPGTELTENLGDDKYA